MNPIRNSGDGPEVEPILAGHFEDEAIAALLHDAAEDAGGRPTLARIRTQFGGLFLRRSVAEEIAAADLWSSQILQQVRLAQWWMELDMEMKTAVVATISRGLVQWHDVRKWHLPKIIELDQDLF